MHVAEKTGVEYVDEDSDMTLCMSSEESFYTGEDSLDFAAISGSRAMGVPLNDINVVTGHPAPFERPVRNGSLTLQQSATRKGSTSRLNGKNSYPTICFICYHLGHITRDCPHREFNHIPKWIQWFRENYAKLALRDQEYLRRIRRSPDDAAPLSPSPAATQNANEPMAERIRPARAAITKSLPPPTPSSGGRDGSATLRVRYAESATHVESETSPMPEN